MTSTPVVSAPSAQAQAVQRTFGGLPVRKASDVAPGGSMDFGFTIALYGKGGSGKTSTAATIAGLDDQHPNPYGSPMVFLDCGGDTEVVSHRTDIDVIDVTTWAEIQRFSSKCADLKEPLPWKSIALDNFCEMAEAEMSQRVAPGKTPELRDYNLNTRNMTQFAKFWRKLARQRGVNVVFCFWDETDKSESSGVWETRLSTTPKMANMLQGIFGIIGYLEVVENSSDRKLTFAPSRRTASKFRRAPTSAAMKIPLTIIKPDLGEIVSILKGGAEWDPKRHEPTVRAATSASGTAQGGAAAKPDEPANDQESEDVS